MRYKYIIILLVLATSFASSVYGQNHPLTGKWKVNDGWWGKDTLTLTKVDEQQMGSGIFSLTDYGTIMHMVEPDMSCKIGLFVVEESHWSLANGELNIEMKGRKYTSYYFDYHIIYHIMSKSDNEKMLIASKVLKRKENPDW